MTAPLEVVPPDLTGLPEKSTGRQGRSTRRCNVAFILLCYPYSYLD
jgi:hypothetical protein